MVLPARVGPEIPITFGIFLTSAMAIRLPGFGCGCGTVVLKCCFVVFYSFWKVTGNYFKDLSSFFPFGR